MSFPGDPFVDVPWVGGPDDGRVNRGEAADHLAAALELGCSDLIVENHADGFYRLERTKGGNYRWRWIARPSPLLP